MTKRAVASLGVGLFTAILLAYPSQPTPNSRSFEFTYETEVDNLPEGAKKVAIWMPYPVSDPNQKIGRVDISAPYKFEKDKDPEYGNTILYLAGETPDDGSIKVKMTFTVDRTEYLRRDFDHAVEHARGVSEGGHALWLQPDRLVPLDERIQKLARDVTKGTTTDLEKARAIYEYTVSTMKYDKSGTGWGNGDIYWACDAKRGNCTDFHALFTGLCRASGIPAKFDIGFPLPEKRGEGEIGGYHCWAEFYLKGYGWVPVDASEAWKHPEKKDYFFGAHDENRVQLSTGRDVALNPPQAGDPLNYFIYPYVEVDGKPFKDVKRKFYFKDLIAKSST